MLHSPITKMADNNKPKAEILLGLTSPVLDRPAKMEGFFQPTEVRTYHFALYVDDKILKNLRYADVACQDACAQAAKVIGKSMLEKDVQKYTLSNGEVVCGKQRESCWDMESDDVELFKQTIDDMLPK